MNGEPWTNGDVEALKTLFQSGTPDDYIAVKLSRTPSAVRNARKKFGITGDPRARRFTTEGKSRMGIKPTGADSYLWKGGRRINRWGYVDVFKPEHPRARGNGYVLEHILVMEQSIGRPLLPGECVHHRDKNKQNNSPDNLIIVSRSEHSSKYHKKPRMGVYKVCPICQKEFYVKQSHIGKRITCSQHCAGKYVYLRRKQHA